MLKSQNRMPLSRLTDRDRDLIDAVPHLVWLTNAEGEVEHLNARCLEYFGLPPGSYPDIDWRQIIHPDDCSSTCEEWAHSFQTGAPLSIEYRLRRWDGQYRWHAGRAHPYRDPNGTVVQWFGTCTDIEDLKRGEQERRELLGDLKERVKELSALHATARLLQDHSTAIDVLLGELVQLLPPSLRFPEQAAARVTFGEVVAETPGFNDAGIRIAVPFRISDGTPGVVEVHYLQPPPDSAAPPFLPEEHRLVECISEMLRSYLDRQQVRRSREAAESRFRVAVEKGHDSVHFLAADGTILYVTPSVINMSGRTVEEIVGQSCLRWCHPDDLEEFGRLHAALAQKEGAVATGEYRYQHADGSWRWAEATCTNLLHEPDVRAIVVNCHDVTVRREADDVGRRLAAVVEASADAIKLVTTEGLVEAWNPGAEGLYGYSAAEIVGKPIALIVPPDRKAEASELMSRVSQGERVGTFETVRMRKDGGLVHVSLSLSPIVDVCGRVTGVSSVTRDIGPYKRITDSLLASNNLLRAVTDGTTDAVFVKNADGRYLLCNPATADFFGRAAADVLGRRDTDFFDVRSAALVREHDLRVMETGRTETKEELLTAQGVTRTYLATKAPYRDDSGHIVGVIGVSRDITNRKQAENEREKFAALVENAGEFIGMATLDGRVFYVNSSGRRLVGLEADLRQEVVRVEDFVPGDVAAMYHETAFVTAKAGQRWEGSVRFRHLRTGENFEVQQCIFVVCSRDDGAPLCLATVARNVTEERQLETQLRQAQRMEGIGRLAGGIAHDFNNLLTIINGYSEIVLSSLHEQDPSRSLVEEVQKAGIRAAGLTRQLLAFSRKQILQQKVLDLHGLVNELATMLKRMIGEDIQLVTATETALMRVKADPGQLEQVLMNLAVNARDAMPKGGKLTIETRNIALERALAGDGSEIRPGPYVLLSVTDTGSGISAEALPNIFEPFYTTKPVGEGTGLGLSTVYGIVKQTGGHVEVESQLGVGTVFRVYLPAIPRRLTDISRSENHPALPRGHETILLVEDEEGVRKLVALLLRQQGYTVLEATRGEQAIELAQETEHDIHLLMTDVVMPGIGGRDVAEQLVLFNPRLKVLFMSGYTDDRVVRHGVEQDRVHFLAKPFSPGALARKIRYVLDKRSA